MRSNHWMHRSCVGLLMLAVSAFAQTPLDTAFIYQGRLKESGQPFNGNADLVFRLFDAPTRGTLLGSQSLPATAVVDGLFTVQLNGGSEFGATAFNGEQRWLEVEVNGTTLSPRQPLTATPYAIFAAAPWTTNGDALSYTGGNVGIGNDDPQYPLDVSGRMRVRAAGDNGGGMWLTDPAFPTVSKSFVGRGADADDWTGIWSLGWHFVVTDAGHVGIGTTTPGQKLTVAGTVESTAGGFKYPDGSVQTTAASALAANTRTPQQIALLRWYDAIQTEQTFPVGNGPFGVAFDGANVWLANRDSDSVTKLRASDGANLDTFPVGSGPVGVAFDGANIWVANVYGENVTKLRASDGADLGTFPVGLFPFGVAFDGANIWVANNGSDNVTKLRASDGANLDTFPVGDGPFGVAFDGANIWVANNGSNNVTKLRASDGANLGTFPVGYGPWAVAFDGANIWVVNQISDSVTKLRASDGATLGTFPVGNRPVGVAFDGANIWVANRDSNNVTKLRASDGANLGTFPVGYGPWAVAFDGANIWVANQFSNSVSKL